MITYLIIAIMIILASFIGQYFASRRIRKDLKSVIHNHRLWLDRYHKENPYLKKGDKKL